MSDVELYGDMVDIFMGEIGFKNAINGLICYLHHYADAAATDKDEIALIELAEILKAWANKQTNKEQS